MVMHKLAVLAAVALSLCAQVPAVDWSKVNPEVLEHFSSLIRIDTTSPPGNETKAVEYLMRVLDREGIAYQVFALEPMRAYLVARILGNGSLMPFFVMGHTD